MRAQSTYGFDNLWHDGCHRPASAAAFESIETHDPHAIDPLVLYATGIGASDYVSRIFPLLSALTIGDLLDVGAGGGQLGATVRERDRRWTCIEPSTAMRTRLSRLGPSLVLPHGWEDADVAPETHDTVLAANIAAPLTAPKRFLETCRRWATRNIVWVVPAQNGPRGLCLAGCLPAEWHGEDETPGIDIVLAQLSPEEAPASIAVADWTFSLIATDVPGLASYLADRLSWTSTDARRSELVEHLTRRARPVRGGFRLDVPRKSAVLVWRDLKK
ncbi:class I SAM-dependent methyltransferase [Hyphomicrobium nitrativorans]|uniref:class I SAM-dependent methyltransferase n=1 Tax=Hyphomicrobium nitrativorans TaxID=1427356 RepID=UPI000A5AFE4F|nr:class I SAM-dependent methyltransferase [Hyphomicrobium nitrativorans]